MREAHNEHALEQVQMKPVIGTLLAEMRRRFVDAVRDVVEFRDDAVITIDRKSMLEVFTFLRDNSICPFPLCEDVFGIDQLRDINRFEVNYHFFSIHEKVRLHFKVMVDDESCSVPSITGIYPGADWYEREAFDMYGIGFEGHPDLRRAYMPEDFQYFPLRKDFPVMGIPGSLTLPKR
jgi:NADH-quinone oxidoreductase subunit C